MFYLLYAARNLWRNRRWSAFAVFSIAAGVATIVALRSLGLSIGDSLTSNLRATNHGDVTISQGAYSLMSFGFGTNDSHSFDADTLDALSQWASERGGEISAYFSTAAVQITAMGTVTVGRPQFLTSYFIDPQTYPPSGPIEALDPPGVPLSDLLSDGREVVISQNLAQSQEIPCR